MRLFFYLISFIESYLDISEVLRTIFNTRRSNEHRAVKAKLNRDDSRRGSKKQKHEAPSFDATYVVDKSLR